MGQGEQVSILILIRLQFHTMNIFFRFPLLHYSNVSTQTTAYIYNVSIGEYKYVLQNIISLNHTEIYYSQVYC
jgi:hypothetical protein